jgi:cobalt/nickel transport system permease protein
MHIPDGFLSTLVSVALWAVSIVVIGYALKRVSRDMGERQVPLMGVLAACIFAGQMLNFAVTGGTSGHLLGAALATILLGPWGAVLTMTCVVAVQALVFQDGGLLALGANLFNMAVVGVFVSYMVYQFVRRAGRGRPWTLWVGGFAAAWSSIFIASLAAALELAVSGTSPANLAVPAMGLIHALIGAGEGLITVGALGFLRAARPDLLQAAAPGRTPGGRLVWVAGLAIAVALAIASPIASANPDGLESVAEQLGFLESAQPAVFTVIPDYVMPGVTDEALATILAGVAGTLLVFGAALGLAWARRNRTAQQASAPPQAAE